MAKRIKFIDVSKGIAITMIVLGHSLVYSEHCSTIYHYLYSFHVALFFILSGYTFRIPSNYYLFVKKCFKRIMVPYFIWSFIFLVPYIAFGSSLGFKSISSSSFDIRVQIFNILFGNGNDFALKQNSSLWFLPALFSMKCIYGLFLKTIRQHKDSVFKDVVLLVIILILGFLSSKYTRSSYMPWGLKTVLEFGLFFFIGYLLNQYQILEKCRHNIIAVVVFNFMIGTAACFLNAENVSAADYKYGIYLLAIISGLCLSLVIIMISTAIDNNAILEYIGRNTLSILIFHKSVIIIFQSKMGVISNALKYSNIIVEIIIAMLVTAIAIIFSLIVNIIINKFTPIIMGNDKNTSTSYQKFMCK